MSSSDQQTARLMRKERYTLTTSSWAKLSVTKGAKRTGNQQKMGLGGEGNVSILLKSDKGNTKRGEGFRVRW